jgi:hypothetical protein
MSTSFRPCKKTCILLKLYKSDRGRSPTALDTLNRPPTQSQKPKTFSSLIPNFLVAGRLVLTAHRCAPRINSDDVCSVLGYLLRIQSRQVFALRIVSAVVKVLLTMTKSVCSTSTASTARWKSIGSTFARNFSFRPAEAA